MKFRDEREAASIREKIKACLEEANRCELIEEFVQKSPIWITILLPMLEEDIRVFQEVHSWDAPEKDFPKERAAAWRSRTIRDYFLSREKGRDTYMKEAKRLGELLEVAIQAGRVSKETE